MFERLKPPNLLTLITVTVEEIRTKSPQTEPEAVGIPAIIRWPLYKDTIHKHISTLQASWRENEIPDMLAFAAPFLPTFAW